MREEDGVDAFEEAVADVVGLGAEELFGDAGPDLEGAGEVLVDHHLLTAKAAMKLTTLPELWPSPWPGAPAMMGSW